MRSDLDGRRERHVLREMRQDPKGIASGEWGWVHHFLVTKPDGSLELKDQDPGLQRPGTEDGGY